jgi:hypothetical protein
MKPSSSRKDLLRELMQCSEYDMCNNMRADMR